jgi:hypothetical protein
MALDSMPVPVLHTRTPPKLCTSRRRESAPCAACAAAATPSPRVARPHWRGQCVDRMLMCAVIQGSECWPALHAVRIRASLAAPHIWMLSLPLPRPARFSLRTRRPTHHPCPRAPVALPQFRKWAACIRIFSAMDVTRGIKNWSCRRLWAASVLHPHTCRHGQYYLRGVRCTTHFSRCCHTV